MWYIMNTKEKMSLKEVAEWFGCECTVLECTKFSNRYDAKPQKIYIVGAVGDYCNGNTKGIRYTIDTGYGYKGTGTVDVTNEFRLAANGRIDATRNPVNINEKQKLTVWVFK